MRSDQIVLKNIDEYIAGFTHILSLSYVKL